MLVCEASQNLRQLMLVYIAKLRKLFDTLRSLKQVIGDLDSSATRMSAPSKLCQKSTNQCSGLDEDEAMNNARCSTCSSSGGSDAPEAHTAERRRLREPALHPACPVSRAPRLSCERRSSRGAEDRRCHTRQVSSVHYSQ